MRVCQAVVRWLASHVPFSHQQLPPENASAKFLVLLKSLLSPHFHDNPMNLHLEHIEMPEVMYSSLYIYIYITTFEVAKTLFLCGV